MSSRTLLWYLNFKNVSPAEAHCHDALLETGKGQLLFSESSEDVPSFPFFPPCTPYYLVTVLGPGSEIQFKTCLYLGDREPSFPTGTTRFGDSSWHFS